MDLKTLINTPPWDWPSDAGKLFQNILHDSRAQKSDRLMAAELAGDSTVINDDLADALMAIYVMLRSQRNCGPERQSPLEQYSN